MKHAIVQPLAPVTHPFIVMPKDEGGFVIVYPDLPGCLGQCETIEEVAAEASEIWILWCLTAVNQGLLIPEATEFDGALVRR